MVEDFGYDAAAATDVDGLMRSALQAGGVALLPRGVRTAPTAGSHSLLPPTALVCLD